VSRSEDPAPPIAAPDQQRQVPKEIVLMFSPQALQR